MKNSVYFRISILYAIDGCLYSDELCSSYMCFRKHIIYYKFTGESRDNIVTIANDVGLFFDASYAVSRLNP